MQQEQPPQNTPLQSKQQYEYHFSEAAMRHYFYKPSQIYLWLLTVGTLVGMIGIGTVRILGPSLIILGLAFCAAGGIPLLIHYTDVPSDSEYTKWVSERSQPLYGKALQRLHLDESQCERIIEVQGGDLLFASTDKKIPRKGDSREASFEWLSPL